MLLLSSKKNEMKLEYFKISEFDSPDVKGSGINMDQDFLELLDCARSYAGIPFKINSGYRTKEHNKKVGGVKDSSHLIGRAADISCKDSKSRALIIGSLLEAGFMRVGVHKSFIHVDNDVENKSFPVIWLY